MSAHSRGQSAVKQWGRFETIENFMAPFDYWNEGWEIIEGRWWGVRWREEWLTISFENWNEATPDFMELLHFNYHLMLWLMGLVRGFGLGLPGWQIHLCLCLSLSFRFLSLIDRSRWESKDQNLHMSEKMDHGLWINWQKKITKDLQSTLSLTFPLKSMRGTGQRHPFLEISVSSHRVYSLRSLIHFIESESLCCSIELIWLGPGRVESWLYPCRNSVRSILWTSLSSRRRPDGPQ